MIKGETPGVLLKVSVHFGLEEVAAGYVIADTLDALRDKIKDKFSKKCANCYANELIIQTKDADNNLHPLPNNPELELDGELKPAEGKYRVYVKVPPKVAIAAGFDNLLDFAEADSTVFDVTRASYMTDTHRPFVNRVKEIRQLCHYFSKNIELCYSAQDQAVTKRKTLVFSSQMFGAGKTTLGSNFLLQLNANPDHIAECKKLGKVRDEAFTHLLSLRYVLVDLRGSRPLAHAHLELIKKLANVEVAGGNYKQKQHPKLREALNFRKLTFCHIVRAFEAEFGHHYLVQFDGIGGLLAEAGLQGSADLLADISTIQDNYVTPGSLVYLTSRSPLFYLRTKWLTTSVLSKWTPPSTARNVVLDSLNADHVRAMMPNNIDEETSRAVAEMIAYRTGGVPRFIVGALDMLEGKHTSEWLSLVKGAALFSYLKENFGEELGAWQNELGSQDEKTRNIAVELVRFVSLYLPFSLDEVLDSSWADAMKARLPNSETLSLQAVPFLLCSIFPLYVTRVPLEERKEKEDLWRFVIPPVCLEAVRSTSQVRLPPMQQPIKSTSAGEYLEAVVQRCVRLRVSDVFVCTRGKPTAVLFPFLSGTPIAEEKLNCHGYAAFPKLVREKSIKTEDELKEIMEDAAKNYPLPDVNRNHLPQLLELMPRDLLSIPMDKSHSADLFYLTERKHLIEWQMKADAQVLQPATAVDELLKSSWECIGAQLLSLTFIFVCLEGVSKNFFEHMQPSSETEYAFHFKPGSRFVCKNQVCSQQGAACKGQNDCVHAKAKPNEFVVPQKMEVVILKRAGLSCLFSEASIQASIQAMANIQSDLWNTSLGSYRELHRS